MTNPRLDAMRREFGKLSATSSEDAAQRARDLRRAEVIRAALRAYRTDADLERAEAEARAHR